MIYDFAETAPADRYKLLAGCVVPRPIALVSTTDGKGGCACAVAATRPASSLGAWLLGALIGLRTLGRRRRSA